MSDEILHQAYCKTCVKDVWELLISLGQKEKNDGVLAEGQFMPRTVDRSRFARCMTRIEASTSLQMIKVCRNFMNG